MMGEVFAPTVKGAASSIAVCTNWTLTFVVTFTFGKLLDGLGEKLDFLVVCHNMRYSKFL
jgi:SP family facilitated glucose transporter-like MFS transporter 8